MTFVDNGNGTGTLSGTPAAGTGGIYALHVHGDERRRLERPADLHADGERGPGVTSAATTTFAVGAAGTLHRDDDRVPRCRRSRSPARCPAGVTFVDNLDGTGDVQRHAGGRHGAAPTRSRSRPPTAWAVPSPSTFTLNVNEAPVITSASSATFAVGAANSFTVIATGFPAPSLVLGGAALPAGVTCVDNGNGTGTLSGTPAAGTGGDYALTFTASNDSGSAVQNFTLTVTGSPGFTSAATTTFTVGTPGTFTVTAIGAPPPGHHGQWDAARGRDVRRQRRRHGTLSGTPAAGTGGTYALTLHRGQRRAAGWHADLHADRQPGAGDHQRSSDDVHGRHAPARSR